MPVGAVWKPDSLTAPAASKFIDVLAQICGSEMGASAQFPKDSAKLDEAILGDSRVDPFALRKIVSNDPRLRTFLIMQYRM